MLTANMTKKANKIELRHENFSLLRTRPRFDLVNTTDITK
jgi:hypothetical protein